MTMAGKRKREQPKKKSMVKQNKVKTPQNEESLLQEDIDMEDIENDMEDIDIEEDMEEDSQEEVKQKKTLKKLKNKKKQKVAEGEDSESDFEDYLDEREKALESDDEEEEEGAVEKVYEMDDEEEDMDEASFWKSVNKLKKTDPELYNELKRGGEIEDGGMDEEDDEEEMEEDNEEEEEEERHEVRPKRAPITKITLKMTLDWKNALQTNPTVALLREVIQALHKFLTNVEGDSFQYAGLTEFKSLTRVCMNKIPKSLDIVLKRKPGKDITSSIYWKRMSASVQIHIKDILKMLSSMVGFKAVTLCYLKSLVPYCLPFNSIMLKLLKASISHWGSKNPKVKHWAYELIMKLIENDPKFQGYVFKKMHKEFVANANKSTPAEAAYLCNTLAEAYTTNPQLAYEHSCNFLKMLSIQIKAVNDNRKSESNSTVYNWQFIRSLHLWAEVAIKVPTCHSNVHYVERILTGTISERPSAKFLPLRIHVLRILNYLSQGSDRYIPTFTEALKCLEVLDLKKNVKVTKLDPRISFDTHLRLGKSALRNPDVKLALVLDICKLLVESLALEAGRPYFRDLAEVPLYRMRQLLKNIEYFAYRVPLKQVRDKIMENKDFIEKIPFTGSVQSQEDCDKYVKDLKETPPLLQFLKDLQSKKVQLGAVPWTKKDDVKEEKEETPVFTKKFKKGPTTIPEGEDVVEPLVLSEEENEEADALQDDDDDDDDDDEEEEDEEDL